MWYLSGQEPHGTGDGTAVTERAARWKARWRRPADPFPPGILAGLMHAEPPPSPFGMPGMMGMGGFPFGGGPMGGFPMGGNPFGTGPMLTAAQHHLLFLQRQAQRAARERWDALP